MNELPQTLADAIKLYAQDPSVSSLKKKLANLKTTLKKMVLPEFNFDEKALAKPEKCYSQIHLKYFANEAKNAWFSAEKKALDLGKTPDTIKNYRSHFMRFLKWMESQDWYLEVAQPLAIPNLAPPIKAGITLATLHKGRKHSGANPYALKEDQLTSKLKSQIKEIKIYLTSEWSRSQKNDSPVKESSWLGYQKCILCFLGWLKNIIGFELCDLDISLMAEQQFLNDYIGWHLTEKGNSYRQAQHIAIAALNVAKWHFGKTSKFSNFADCVPVLEIRDILRKISKKMKSDLRTSSSEALKEKLLELQQCQEIVEYLRCCCAERTSDSNKRPINAIVDSWQDYLIAAILTYTPVRQREIRELKIGKNLRRDDDGWWVTLTPTEHKTGSKTGKTREFPLFPCHLKERLTHDLDLYINKWRKQENLTHDYLFFRPGGVNNRAVRGEAIPNSNYLACMVPKLFLKVSVLLYGLENAKHPSPHDFRRICATWVCKYGTPDELPIFAEIMGHSPEVLLKTYQQCNSRDKTERAEMAFLKIREREAEIKAQKSQKAIPQLTPIINIPPAVMEILTPKQKQHLAEQGLL